MFDLHSILETSEQLMTLDPSRAKPSDLPGRFGRVVHDVERLLQACVADATVVGGWSVWHYGYVGRVTHDLDIVISHEHEEPLVRLSSMFGFRPLGVHEGNWPKLEHKETGIEVDLMPEGRRPGLASNLGPTPIRHPREYASSDGLLPYVTIAGLFELKLGSWRVKDQADLIELIKVNGHRMDAVHSHVAGMHGVLNERFEYLVAAAKNETNN
ncbi:MAG: hypothetical protein NTW52_07830 [Planctomycetota bacterium]|nr:hypothetical protein [Planctomycetota bacterium]